MKICAGAWLNCDVCIDRTMVRSSATFERCGRQLRDLRARTSVLLELERRTQQLRPSLDEREPLALDELLRDVLPVVIDQRRLGIEQIDLRRRAGHEEKNDALGLGREVQSLRLRRRVADCARTTSPISEASASAANPEGRRFEEVTARHLTQSVRRQPSVRQSSVYSLVTASSRFSSTLATIVQAASVRRA